MEILEEPTFELVTKFRLLKYPFDAINDNKVLRCAFAKPPNYSDTVEYSVGDIVSTTKNLGQLLQPNSPITARCIEPHGPGIWPIDHSKWEDITSDVLDYIEDIDTIPADDYNGSGMIAGWVFSRRMKVTGRLSYRLSGNYPTGDWYSSIGYFADGYAKIIRIPNPLPAFARDYFAIHPETITGDRDTLVGTQFSSGSIYV